MADNKTASAKTDQTKNDPKTENLPETTGETLPPSPLHTDHGSTLIAEQVVQKIAGIACREVPGIHAMGSTGRRMLSSITDRIPGSTTNVSNGVQVEKGERQCAIDLSVVIEYGYSVVEVANKLRETIIDAVEYGTGLEVVEVNVQVTDVYLQGDDEGDEDQPAQTISQRKNTELS
ncbi:Asp23/Gls24 family envelope stress response protein [Cutibacterium sp.]|uniref:Asp23/Gls24 family envelope stress response protein n=1 Tax=Cutibacterium sp. TaxID=1912221 RepID=UPI0026DCE8E2|nr:Asp23/Gls24 family envelope stress response protein [Cutibacterium sp.]MDO4412856.1 Asp23/Gls24 family envelope stress response protein [Cutibacterium sp.]